MPSNEENSGRSKRSRTRTQKRKCPDGGNEESPAQLGLDQRKRAHPPASTTPSSIPPTHTLLFILSPSKTLNVEETKTKNTPIEWTSPECDLERTNNVIRAMKHHCNAGAAATAKLLGISANLAATAQGYWKTIRELPLDTTPAAAMTTSSTQVPHYKPAIYSFKGAAYHGLDVDTLDAAEVGYLQCYLRIIDPLHGWLRPMDIIQPYRLEMATTNLFAKGQQHDKDATPTRLVAYWSPAILKSIERERDPHQTNADDRNVTIINVASDEYSSAIKGYRPQIKIVFRHEGRVIAIHAKRARGLFIRYCTQNRVKCTSDLKRFNLEGYAYQEKISDQTTFVFDRRKHWSQE